MNTTRSELERTPQQAKADALALLPDDAREQATVLVASGVFPSMKSVGHAVVAVELGRALGLPPALAMSGISIVEGRPFIGANVLARAVKMHEKYDYRITTHTADECTIEFFEVSDDGRESIGESTYTIDDAKLAGAKFKSSKGNALTWSTVPKNMLFARALSNGVKWYAPDAVATTVYVNEERDLIRADIREERETEVAEAVELITDDEVAELEAGLASFCESPEHMETILMAEGVDAVAELTPEKAANVRKLWTEAANV